MRLRQTYFLQKGMVSTKWICGNQSFLMGPLKQKCWMTYCVHVEGDLLVQVTALAPKMDWCAQKNVCAKELISAIMTSVFL